MARYDYYEAKNPIGKKIIELMIEKGLSMRQLELMSGCAKDNIRIFINNPSINCSIGFLIRISRALDVRLNDLYEYLSDEELEKQFEMDKKNKSENKTKEKKNED